MRNHLSAAIGKTGATTRSEGGADRAGSRLAVGAACFCHNHAMAYGSAPGSVLSVVAFGPMLAIVAMLCAVVAMARGEGLAGAAVLVALVGLVLSFVLPTGSALNRL